MGLGGVRPDYIDNRSWLTETQSIITVLYQVTKNTGSWRDRIVAFFCLSQLLVAVMLMPAERGTKALQFRHIIPDVRHLRNKAFVLMCLSKASAYWATWGCKLVNLGKPA